MPYVSIILPTYNRAYILNQAIDSVLAQTYSDWELIVVDDGSIDITQEVVLPYTVKDSRIKYVYQGNMGPASARNRGLKESSGDIIMYLDSDDIYFPHTVARVVQVFAENKIAIFGIGNQRRRIMLVDKNHTILSETEPTVATTGTATLQDIYHWKVKFCGSALFHKRFLWDEKGIQWDNSFPYFEDWHFLLTIGNRYAHGFFFIPDIICEYRLSFGAEGINAESTYQDLAHAFAQVYEAHTDDALMQGQEWYPERVEKYLTWHKEVEAGTRPPAIYKYFGDYFVQKKLKK
jgi:glycosyltransferase involved in cell wall biosynthesis